MPKWERNGPLVGRDTALMLLLALGNTYDEIATAFGVTPGTVRGRCHRVRTRMGVRTNEQMVLESYRRGLITLPGDRVALATVRDRPGSVFWQHACGELEAFLLDAPPADGSCIYCGSSSPHRADWRPVWAGDRPAVAS